MNHKIKAFKCVIFQSAREWLYLSIMTFLKSKVSFCWECNIKSVVLNFFVNVNFLYSSKKKSIGSFQKQGFSCRYLQIHIYRIKVRQHSPVSIELQHSGKKVLQLKLLWKRLSYSGVAFLLVRVPLKLKNCSRSHNIVFRLQDFFNILQSIQCPTTFIFLMLKSQKICFSSNNRLFWAWAMI